MVPNVLAKRRKFNCGLCVISVFRREVHENSSLLGCYEGSSGNLLPTFRGILSTPSSGIEMDPIGCPKTS